MTEPRTYTKPFVVTTLAFFCFFTNVNAYNRCPCIRDPGCPGRRDRDHHGHVQRGRDLGADDHGAAAGSGWRKPCVLTAAALLIAVSAGFGVTGRLGWPLYLLRFLQGLGFAVYMTSSMTLIADLAPPARRAEAVGIYGTGGLVAVALGPAVGELILSTAGYPAFFAATVAVAAATLTLAASVPAPAARPPHADPAWGGRRGSRSCPSSSRVSSMALPTSSSLSSCRPLPTSWDSPGLARSTSPTRGPRSWSASWGVVWPTALAGERVIVPALGAMTAGILLCSGLHATWLLVLIGVLNGTAQGFVMPAANALAFERAPSGRRGQALAFYNGANLVGATLGASGFGWLVQALGYRPAFVLASGVLALGSWAFWRQRSDEARSAPGADDEPASAVPVSGVRAPALPPTNAGWSPR